MSSLATEIKNFQNEFIPTMPKDTVEKIFETTEKLVKSNIAQQALNEGDLFPDFTLKNARGERVSLQQILSSGPIIVNFYRGGWCPYCNLELRAYQNQLERIKEKGGDLVAISPQLPDKSFTDAEKHALEFEVLSDVGNQLSKQLGLVFELDTLLKPIYSKFGFSLEEYNGDTSWTLPIPATYIVDTDRTIRYAFIDADYTKRAEPTDVIDRL